MNIKEALENTSDYELIQQLKKWYFNNYEFSKHDKELLNLHITEDYRLMGIIGLILQNKPRILLGSKQSIDIEIKDACDQIRVSLDEMSEFADRHLDDDYSQEPEEVLRNLMLAYPIDVFENEYLKNN